MAKCHPVNESAYNSDTGPWITIKSLHVAWMWDGNYFHLISSNDFLIWWKTYTEGNVRLFRYLTEHVQRRRSVSSNDSCGLGIITRVWRHKLSHDGNYCCNIARYRRGTLNTERRAVRVWHLKREDPLPLVGSLAENLGCFNGPYLSLPTSQTHIRNTLIPAGTLGRAFHHCGPDTSDAL